jgi:hypothetical protein
LHLCLFGADAGRLRGATNGSAQTSQRRRLIDKDSTPRRRVLLRANAQTWTQPWGRWDAVGRSRNEVGGTTANCCRKACGGQQGLVTHRPSPTVVPVIVAPISESFMKRRGGPGSLEVFCAFMVKMSWGDEDPAWSSQRRSGALTTEYQCRNSTDTANDSVRYTADALITGTESHRP